MSDVNGGPEDVLAHTATIVAAFASTNHMTEDALASVIRRVHTELKQLDEGAPPPKVEEPPTPAVPIKKSVTPDYIVCLEDGQKLKMLKRYLRTHYNMSPQEYRAKWGLPADYPMVAPNYAERRSALAKKIGLGRKPTARPAVAAKRGPRKGKAE